MSGNSTRSFPLLSDCSVNFQANLRKLLSRWNRHTTLTFIGHSLGAFLAAGPQRCCPCAGGSGARGLGAHSCQSSRTTREWRCKTLFEQDRVQLCLSSSHTKPDFNFSLSGIKRNPRPSSRRQERGYNLICLHLKVTFIMHTAGSIDFHKVACPPTVKWKSSLSCNVKFYLYCFFGSLGISADPICEFLHAAPLLYADLDEEMNVMLSPRPAPPPPWHTTQQLPSRGAPVFGICAYSVRACCRGCPCSCCFVIKKYNCIHVGFSLVNSVTWTC